MLPAPNVGCLGSGPGPHHGPVTRPHRGQGNLSGVHCGMFGWLAVDLCSCLDVAMPFLCATTDCFSSVAGQLPQCWETSKAPGAATHCPAGNILFYLLNLLIFLLLCVGQFLLSQAHRLQALELLGRFLDLGPWAVSLSLSVGIFPYVLKLLGSKLKELQPILVFIWAKILAVDPVSSA